MWGGATTLLSDSVTGGTWSSSAASISSIAADGVVTGLAAGYSIITYAVSNICGTTVCTHVLTVRPLPNAGVLSGSTSVCPSGATTVLSASVAGGTWSSSSLSLATVNTLGLITGVAPGTDTIIYSVTNGCGVASVSHSLTINPLPNAGTISGPHAICQEATAAYSDASVGGVWSISSSATAHIDTHGNVTGIAGGMTVITYTQTNVCGVDSTTFAISVNPLPTGQSITGTDSLCLDDTATFLASVPGGTWLSGNTAVATVSPGGLVTALSTGFTVINYIVTNDCGSNMVSVPLLVRSLSACPSAIENVGFSVTQTLNINPNPNRGFFTVTFTSGSSEKAELTITNVLGERVKTLTIFSNHEICIQLDAAPGLYFITLEGTDGRVVRKFVKL